MPPAPIPFNETERLFALRALHLLNTPAEERFDRVTRLLAGALEVPITTISLIDATRQWFKSSIGICATETPREQAFCAYTILEAAPLIVPDATLDPRFADHPMVTGEPHIRFYAGQPITVFDSFRIGTLCAVDTRPRELDQRQLDILRDLAAIVESEIAGLAQAAHTQERFGR